MDFTPIISGLAIIAAFGIGYWVNRWFNGSKTKSSENATVLLERIKNVCKLITVEGYFSEVYDYTDYWGYDLPGFRKKALIRVKARVSAGFDMTMGESMGWRVEIEGRRHPLSVLN